MKILTSHSSDRPQQIADSGKSLIEKTLPFDEFVEAALYAPRRGYYTRVSGSPDYATSGRISPVFSYAVARVVSEFAGRVGDGLFSVVDIGCGDGSLISASARQLPDHVLSRSSLFGIDRAAPLPQSTPAVHFSRNLAAIPTHLPVLIISNELFDALPFARLVRRGRSLRELYVTESLSWEERDARPEFASYLQHRGVDLADGQFADVSLGWERKYRELCDLAPVAMIVTFDYGYPQEKLFDNRARRFGTAAAYSRHAVHRDLLARPGEQDLTAHINFTDLIQTGEICGFETLAFTRQAEFLLSVGITDHPLFAPADQVDVNSLDDAVRAIDQREAARRLVLPDGIGQDIRVLVQARGVPAEDWSFQRPPFERLTRWGRCLQ